ncbi:MAG: xylose isomerase, partial [Acidobacteriota bacterium]|nr:xylose isomerase [Acidobacteriota bacterium]
AYRTEDYEGVKDFARGCMRTYLILKEKAKRWNEHPEIAAILGDSESLNNNAKGRVFSEEDSRSLLEAEFDRNQMASRGLQYERLDQITMDILLGVE